MVHREKFSQTKYDIIFQIAKTYTMSEIDSRKTNTNSSCTRVYRDHKYFKGKKLPKTLATWTVHYLHRIRNVE